MTTALAKIDASSPLAARPMQRLPEWVSEKQRGMARSVFGYEKETFISVPLTDQQRATIESSRGDLVRQLEQTPHHSSELNDALMDAIGELLLAKPHRADAGALWAEATVRSFSYALDDIPAWATLRAIRNWYRGECESYDDPKGKYDYRWLPDPADLRQIAKRYMREVKDRIEIFDDLLNAKLRDCRASAAQKAA